MNENRQKTISLFQLSNYSFGNKAPQSDDEGNAQVRLQRLKNYFEVHGMRRTVEAVLLVHEHNHPHILMLQRGTTFFKLPGESLDPGEDEIEGLAKRLSKKLSPLELEDSVEWNIGECLAVWWRPNFENYMYPYPPPHVTKIKEEKKIFLVNLPEKFMFAIPKNMNIVAVPLIDIYDNGAQYGPIISSIPHLLSKHITIYY